MQNLTPAMRQYMEIKNKNPDCLVFFRMGDFYETFYDDAKLAAKVLNITLTSRGKGEKKAPLAGIPYHALNTYLIKLIKNNIKVAIVEQTEDPKKATGLVKRDLIRIITPGTIVEEDFLQGNENNYLLAVSSGTSKEPFGLAYVDISTGEFKVSQVDSEEKLRNEIAKLNPSEIIVSSEEKLKFNHYTTKRPVHTFFIGNAKELLEDHFKAPINSFGLETKNKVVEAAGALINYLKETQKTNLSYINKISYYELSNFMTIDSSTQRNLELVKNIMDNSKKGTLFEVMDKTVTSAGGREFKRWLLRPLLKIDEIKKRLDSVEILKDDALLRAEIRDVLKKLYDIERLISKVSFGNANPKDMISLKLSLAKLPKLLFLLKDKTGLLGELSKMPDVNDIVELLEYSLIDEPPIIIREGGIIKTGFNEKLDELHNIKKDGRKYISEIESREIEKTNIKSLKVKFNRVFGYFIEVTKKNVHLVPQNYIRKQTQVNCERYITQELKEIEEKILSAQEKINEMEYELFNEIVSKVNSKTKEIQEIASKLAKIDVLASLAELADKNSYCKPEVNNGYDFEIKESRHPVIESFEDNFISNDCIFSDKQKMMIITGPNMAGKCVTGDTYVFTNKGMIKIKKLIPRKIHKKEFVNFKLGIKGIHGTEDTSHFYYDGVREIIKIKTQYGFTLSGTKNHPILIRNKEGKEIWKKLSQLKKEDRVIIKRDIGLWGKTTNIKENEKILKYDYNNNVKKYILPNKIDKKLAYCMGILIGDGTLTYKNHITLTNIDKEIILNFKNIIKEKFGYIVKKKSNKYDYFISSVIIRKFFENVGLSYETSLNKKIPHSILKSPKNIVVSFLSGLFDTDGRCENRYGNVSYSSSSYQLATEVHLLLLNLGIISSLRIKKTNKNTNYRVSLYGEEAIKFHKLIGFKVKRKDERKKLSSNLRMPNKGIPYLENILKKIQKRIVEKTNKKESLKSLKKINSIFYTYLKTNRNISYNKLLELIKYCKKNKIKHDELKLIYDTNYFYDSIESISKEKKEDVYDFSVPKTHSFVANGLINHNSTYMRQNSLIVLMAQIGSYVPASFAKIGVVDRIFSRVGAYDDLAHGQSTFMVEMTETANILNNATKKSLIILDEIGRGTSTFDGVAIAWSVAEHIHEKIKAKTMFATHYHVLNTLEKNYSDIQNYSIAVLEEKNKIVFLRKIVPGATDKSYGIHVAALAGVPNVVIQRAKKLQAKLEQQDKMDKKINGKRKIENQGLKDWLA